MGLDPGGHFLRHPRTPLQSAPPAPTMQCWVPGLHVRKEHAWVKGRMLIPKNMRYI